jgi:plasmid stabilization system protein ParE
MKATIQPGAEADLEYAHDYYEGKRRGLGKDFVHEFRKSLDYIVQYPRGWQQLDEVYRRCRLHRFPYGIVYRIDDTAGHVVIVAVLHLSRDDAEWRDRE